MNNEYSPKIVSIFLAVVVWILVFIWKDMKRFGLMILLNGR